MMVAYAFTDKKALILGHVLCLNRWHPFLSLCNFLWLKTKCITIILLRLLLTKDVAKDIFWPCHVQRFP